MGWEDPTPLVDLITNSASYIRDAVKRNYDDLPDGFQEHFFAALVRQERALRGLTEQLETSSWAADRIRFRRGFRRVNAPRPYRDKPRWYPIRSRRKTRRLGYDDPMPFVDRIVSSASYIKRLTEHNYGELPDGFHGPFFAALASQEQELRDLISQLGIYSDVAGSVKGRPTSLPKPYRATRGWSVVAGMPVWHVDMPRWNSDDQYVPAPADAQVVVYLDEYSDAQLQEVQAAAIKFGEELGYTDFILTDEEKGSIFRRFRGKLKDGLASDFVQQKMMELDERGSIEIVGRARAETDAIKTANAVNLIAVLADIPNAVVRVGGLLVIKQTDSHGVPAVLTRELTTREIRALELNPGIQRDPHGALELLAAAVAQLEEDERNAQ